MDRTAQTGLLQESEGTEEAKKPIYIALAGNPNSGKTTVFNALTGLRAHVGNYPGVTVERREGKMRIKKREVQVLDLPGCYSLIPHSLDERISRDVLLHRRPEIPPISLVVLVVDASSLERQLYLVTQVLELGIPAVVALNMMDLAAQAGLKIDVDQLARQLGCPVVPMVANRRSGIESLIQTILRELDHPSPRSVDSLPLAQLPSPWREEVDRLARLIIQLRPDRHRFAIAEALLALIDQRNRNDYITFYGPEFAQVLKESLERLGQEGCDGHSFLVQIRYEWITRLIQKVVSRQFRLEQSWTDRLDRVLTHPFFGTVILIIVMLIFFQAIFSLAELPQQLLEAWVDQVGGWVASWLPSGELRDLIVRGIFGGAGSVLVFVPQIAILFFLLGLMEDSGYMARAAFLMDRLMSKVGLHGKSFIPLLSSYACAVPGILATRTIEDVRTRLVTIFIAPFMTCPARLPVFTLLIDATIPNKRIFGFLGLQGLVLAGMYLLGLAGALMTAWIFKKTLLRKHKSFLILELPTYRRPLLRVVLVHTWARVKLFLRKVGTVILGASIILWFLANYPVDRNLRTQYFHQRSILQTRIMRLRPTDSQRQMWEDKLHALDREFARRRLENSTIGRIGRWMEPALRPLGFDWKIGIGILSSFAARELFVSTMALVYGVEYSEGSEGIQQLAHVLARLRRPDGQLVYSVTTGLALMIFYVFALQCISTVVVVRRETNSWRWPLFQWLYMTGLAYLAALAVHVLGVYL